MKISNIDKKLIELIQKGDYCTPRVNELAKKAKVPATTVHNRLRKLRKDGILKGYYGLVDHSKLGRDFTVFVVVKIQYSEKFKDEQRVNKLANTIAKIPEVQEIYLCTGNWDYMVKLVVKDQEDYNRVINRKLLPIGSIRDIQGYVSLNTYKESCFLEGPLDLNEINEKLLELLRTGIYCVPRVNELAKKIHVPPTTIYNRLKKLKQRGILKGYYGLIDHSKLNRGFIVFDIVKVIYSERYSSSKVMRDFGEKIGKIPEVLEVHECTSDWDYLLKVKVKNHRDYSRVARTEILPLGGIEKLMGYVCTEYYKESPFFEFSEED